MNRYFIIFFALYGYAALRYHLGQKLEWDQFLFVLNKAISWTAFVLLTTSILKDRILVQFNLSRRYLGSIGFILAFCHILLSVVLLWGNNYPKFLANGIWSWTGILILLIGLLSIILFTFPFVQVVKRKKHAKYFKWAKWGVILILFHPLLIGYQGWFKPADWPLFMPPITLLSVLYSITIWFIRLKTSKEKS